MPIRTRLPVCALAGGAEARQDAATRRRLSERRSIAKFKFKAQPSCAKQPSRNAAQRPRFNRRACIGHEVQQDGEVVVREQPRAQHLVGAEQVREIGARERRADRCSRSAESSGAKSRVNGGIADVEFARARHRAAVASAARRIDAVEHVDAAVDRVDQIADRADAHEVARLVRGQQRRRETRGAIQILARLADREPADRIAREDRARSVRARCARASRSSRPPWTIPNSSVVARVRARRAALRPARREAHGSRRSRRCVAGSFTQTSSAIATSTPMRFLERDDVLRREAVRAAVEMRRETSRRRRRACGATPG